MKVRMILAVVAALAAAALTAASAQAAPTVLEGELAGAPYKIVVPEAWNGTLVVLAHGYRDPADTRAAMDASYTALADGLAGLGYAVAGTAYRSNGWAVKDGIHDVTALRSFFNGAVGNPDTALLVGHSLGSVVTASLAERANGLFDGYLPACAVVAGASRAWDGGGAHLLAYDVAFGMPAAWGSVADVSDTLDFNTQVFGTLLADTLDPQYFAKTEFIRLVAETAGPDSPLPPGWLPGGLFTNMYFITQARAELERRAGGAFVQNLTHTYTLSPGERAYLAAVGLAPAQIDAMLAAMNGTDYGAEPNARNYVSQYADFTGKLKDPVLTLHTTIDTLVPPAHESAYRQTVAAAGRSDLLAQAYVSRAGHCNFTPEQTVIAITTLEAWAKGGPKPTAFPTAFGFMPPSYAPPAWPQP
jgi:pimeloyl-ACP methyl ester carboxylesterase